MGTIRKVLFIDDEENILSSLNRIFRRDSIRAYFTTDPEEACRLVKEEEFALVVSDQRMPKMEGTELLKRIREISPRSVRIMLTGYADIKSAMRAVNDGNVFRFLAKPWNEQELRTAINAGIGQFELLEENRRLQALTAHQNKELTEFNEDLEKTVAERTEEVLRLNVDLKHAFFSAIKILGSLGGILDPTQEGHSHRVAKISGFIAKDMGMPEKDVFEVQVAAFVMNVGALANGFGKRNSYEIQPEAAKLSAKVASLIPNIGRAPIFVLHQLEKFNGSGPGELAGEEIPLGARIIATASAYDRLLHLGELRAASPIHALDGIKEKIERNFDPAVVQSLERYVVEHLKDTALEFEQNLNLMELQPGMIVSKPVISRRGEILIAKDITLNEEVLENLWQRQMNERPIGEIYVYKNSIPEWKRAA